MKIELPKTKFPSSICNAGNKKPFLSGVTAAESGGVKTLEVSFSGVFNDLAELQNTSCKIGSIELSAEVSSISDSEGSIAWICEGSTLRLGTGGIAELLSKWRSRNDRKTVEDCVNGLMSRTISVRRYGLSNARIEATNNKIKLLIRIAYGFRNIDAMIGLIMLFCSLNEIPWPGRTARKPAK